MMIEEHYQKPMDIEWAYDREEQQLYIVQARPETVQARKDTTVLEEYILNAKGKILTHGASVGKKIGQGKARFIKDPSKLNEFQQGEVLVAEITDPDWEPIMKIASAIVTNSGGRTSHAAIVSRELGIPAIVGCGDATKVIPTGTELPSAARKARMVMFMKESCNLKSRKQTWIVFPHPKPKLK